MLRFASTVKIQAREVGSVQHHKFHAPQVLPCVSGCSGTRAEVESLLRFREG